MEDNKNDMENIIDENNENVDISVNPETFNGYFHERDRLIENNIVNEVKESFLEYSMSVIASRALPDLRDGLKPVHRRILWSMYNSGYTPDKPHRKSAKTVGEVMGNYHPHGDSSIYEAMVRMAQNFSYRYMLIDGHGNFGNIDGDGAAAMRYTESRLSKISLELLRDINKETVNMTKNFDESLDEPEVLPSRFPNILVNGTMGIAVGMATNIPPHNLSEVIDGCVAYIDNPDIDTIGLMQYVKGPDFPTGGLILGNSGIKKAYETGRGSITIRSRAIIEEENGHDCIIITEVPYGVNTLELKNKVAELVHNKVIDGISDYHTDLKDGVKITITLKKDANAQVILNNLFKHTDFQVNYGIIFLMLDGKIPRTLGLKSIISKYVDYQKEVIVRRTTYDLKKAEARVHILEGQKIVLDNIDEVIKIIKTSKSDQEAKEKLISRFNLSEIQTDNILELKLRRLTGMERAKIEEEYNSLILAIADYKDILANMTRVLNIIKTEMLEIKQKYGDDRRTSIDMTSIDYIDDESLIPVENVVFTLTNKGYIKRLRTDTYKIQNRGGVGIKGMTTHEEDFVEMLISARTHDDLLFFTNKGRVYRVKGYEIPEFSRQSKGLPIINILQIEKGENINSIVPINSETVNGDEYLLFSTKQGLVKRTSLKEFENIRKSGKIAILLKENDEVLNVLKTTGDSYIVIAASNGRAVHFKETEIRVMGRNTSGVRGISLDNATVVGCEVVNNVDSDEILVITENGYGKKTYASEYRLTHRGSKGVKALNVTEKNGMLVSMRIINCDNDLMIITNSGMMIRISTEQISTLKRATQGVRLINLKENQSVSTVALVSKEEDIENGEIVEETNNEQVENSNE